MSSERDASAIPDPHGGAATFTYDASGRLTSVQDGVVHTTWRTGTGEPVRPQASGPPRAPAAAAPCLRHCFEFRLGGSESKEQGIALEGFGGAALIAAIERVRAFLTGDGASGAAASAIGGIEVQAGLHSGRLVCTAQLSDFRPGDLVVVQVELALYACGGSR